jgi:hypothetical protein
VLLEDGDRPAAHNKRPTRSADRPRAGAPIGGLPRRLRPAIIVKRYDRIFRKEAFRDVNGEIEVTRLEYVVPFDGDPYDTLLRDYGYWYGVVHGDDDFWAPDDEDGPGMSLAEFDQMFRSAWKAHFGRQPSESEIELAMSGNLLDAATRPVAEEPEDKGEDVDVAEPIRAEPRVGRNDPCPCGSGKKFKKCCLRGT